MALNRSHKGRGRGLSLTQAAVHDAPPTLHGGYGAQTNHRPGPSMLASWRHTQPHGRPRQSRHMGEAGNKSRDNRQSNGTIPEVVNAVGRHSVTSTRKWLMQAS